MSFGHAKTKMVQTWFSKRDCCRSFKSNCSQFLGACSGKEVSSETTKQTPFPRLLRFSV